ncbi:hypothetical protein FHT78_001703 [Rhizobium sp. BK196]|nr:hypothetical protein [Rhizobium sp. BK196]
MLQRFANAPAAAVEDIRHCSIVSQEGVTKYERDHFMRMI